MPRKHDPDQFITIFVTFICIVRSASLPKKANQILYKSICNFIYTINRCKQRLPKGWIDE